MPSDLSYWLISAPLKDGDPNVMLDDVRQAVPGISASLFEIPELKAGTLSSLLSLSDTLPKIDSNFTSTVSKCLDTLRTLTSAPSSSSSSKDSSNDLSQHVRINDRPADEYLMPSGGGTTGHLGGFWRWDTGRWGSGGKVADIIGALTSEMNSIDQQQKQRTQSYNLSKGQLTNLQRKKIGNLSQRSLLDVVKREDLVENSEFMETLLVAVPKNLIKDWDNKYERLSNMVVPRSSQRIAADDEYFLQSVTVFKKIRDEFIHKCRENKFIVRDFSWDEGAAEKNKKEISDLEVEERELWTDLLKLTRINFSESYQILCHLKTIRLFVESVLRYGLPADYSGIIVKPDPKTASKTLKSLSQHFDYLKGSSQAPSRRGTGKKGGSGGGGLGEGEIGGEWQAVMEQEYYDFVLFEIPMVPA